MLRKFFYELMTNKMLIILTQRSCDGSSNLASLRSKITGVFPRQVSMLQSCSKEWRHQALIFIL